MYIDTNNPYDTLALDLKQILRRQGVDVTDSPQGAAVSLKLFSETYHRDTLSESASSSTKEYQLTYQVSYELIAPSGAMIYGPHVIETHRKYIINEDQVTSSNSQQTLLRQEMQRDVMYQLLNQLSSPDVELAITGPQEEPNEQQP